MLRSMTLGERMDIARGKSSGFDYLRIGLALLVALGHIPAIAFGAEGANRLFDRWNVWPAVIAILPMFFALSGFLVAGSLERCRTTPAFLGLRMIRIFPALAVEVVLSALVVGPIFTALPLSDYFGDMQFRLYFLNIFGLIHYELPGVFLGNPMPKTVNIQLWTVPYELFCYLALTALALLGVRRWRALSLALAAGSLFAYAVRFGYRHDWEAPQLYPMGLQHGLFLFWSFLWGVVLYQYRTLIPLSNRLLLSAVIFAVICLAVQGYLIYLIPISLAYVTVGLGLLNPRKLWFLKGADYSYGLFLYHWVVLQAVFAIGWRHWSALTLIGIPLALLVAMLSWHLVEKPSLSLRSRIVAADRTDKMSINGVLSLAAMGVLGVVACFHLMPFFGRPHDAPIESAWVREEVILNQASQARQVNVLVLGDSIVEATDLSALCDGAVLNAGVSGHRVVDILRLAKRLQPSLEAGKAIVAVGVNDALFRNRTEPAEFEKSYLDLIDLFDGKVSISTIVPIGDQGSASAIVDRELVEKYNAILRDIAGERGLALIDMQATFPDGLPQELTTDGLHLSPLGYSKWKSALAGGC